MTYTVEATSIRKSDGWEAKTRVRFHETIKNDMGEEGHRCLTIRTYKTSRGALQTSASASIVAGGVESFVIFGDFSKTVISYPVKRVVEKDVRNQHAGVLITDLPGLIAQVEAYYAPKAAIIEATGRALEQAYPFGYRSEDTEA